MSAQWLVDGVHDRRLMGNALVQRVPDRRRSRRWRLDGSRIVIASILAWMERALALMDEASARIGTLPPPQPVAIRVVAESRRKLPR